MPADELSVQRKRLKVRSQQRGLREVDLLLTDFAQRYLPALSSEQMELYEQLLTLDDQTLYSWISQQCAVHPLCDHQVMDMLIGLASRRCAR